MKTQNKSIILLLFAVLLPFIFGYASLQNKTIEAWFAYWDAQNSLDNFKNNFSDRIHRLNLFFYALEENGDIVNAFTEENEYDRIIQFLKGLDIKISITITNDIIYSKTVRTLKDPEIINKILNDEKLRKKHLEQIMRIIKEIDADGVDINYEKIYIEDKHAFTKFIKELSVLLHSQDKTLTVTVEQKTKDHQKSGAGAVDWQEISKYADKINIMCYGYSSKVSKPGPICPPFWLKKIIKFAKSQIPSDKICIALALHGYDWTGKGVNSLNHKKVVELLKQFPARLMWDRKSQTPYFRYSNDGVQHQVWFENQRSISSKIQLIKKYNINHIAFWHLSIMNSTLSEPLDSFLKQ